jgi:hypothetical protein
MKFGWNNYMNIRNNLKIENKVNRSTDNDIFRQIHIDVARNATDDFNLFHDSKKWQQIHNNPFNGPIVLGFELESLIEDKVRLYRLLHNETNFIVANNLRFSNYQLSFANAVKPEQAIIVDIKPSKYLQEPEKILSNRICVKADGKLAMTGYKKESEFPLFLRNPQLPELNDIRNHPDRSYVKNNSKLPGGAYFLKRKFMNTSNAKNFLCGSLVDQSEYFDELENKASFPEIFPCGLLSCALLEKAIHERHNFKRNPMVYTAHKISVDLKYLAELKSNDMLQILVKQWVPNTRNNDDNVVTYECYGLVKDNNILYRGLISLRPLEDILNSIKRQ